MKAVIQAGPHSVETQEREVPIPGADELLIEVHTAGLCESDVHAYKYNGGYGWILTPRIMGHEYFKTIMEVGANVEMFKAGDKVIGEPIHDCGYCFQCRNDQPNVCQGFSITRMHRDGTCTEYVTIILEHVHAVPEGIPLRHTAITGSTNIAIRAVLDQSVTTPGDNVPVERPGPIGVLVAAVTDSLGVSVVVSRLSQDAAYRLSLLEDLGIGTVNLGEEDGLGRRIESQVDGIGSDVVLDATGHHSGVVSGNNTVRKGGQTIVVSILGSANELSLASTVHGEVDANASYGSTRTSLEQALRLMERDEIVVEKILDIFYSVDDSTAAFGAFLGSEICKPAFQFNG